MSNPNEKKKHYLVYCIDSAEVVIPLSGYDEQDVRAKVKSSTRKITRIEEIVYPEEE